MGSTARSASESPERNNTTDPYGPLVVVVVVVLVGATVVVVVVVVVAGSVVLVLAGTVVVVLAVGVVTTVSLLRPGTLEVEIVVDVVVVVGVVPVSGLTQPAAGPVEPVWPGMSTVPAQPKSTKVAVSTDVPPSAKRVVETAWRMNPLASMPTTTVVPV
jgi:hypothetical protein